jgi:hypothetical protein
MRVWNFEPFRKRSGNPPSLYCPFEKACAFLNGESPESILAERDALAQRVSELEFGLGVSAAREKRLSEEIQELKESNSQLKTELSQALQAPFKKHEKKEPAANPRKRGPPFGHKGHFRKKPEHIDRRVEVFLNKCPICGNLHISLCANITEHTQEDLEDGKATVTLFIHHHYWCNQCKETVHGWGEAEIPHAFIGPELRGKASFLRYEIKVSYDNVCQAFKGLCNFSFSPGAAVAFDNRLSQKGEPLYKALKESLPHAPVMHADETGWKRDWLWIFTNPKTAFFHIDESRGSKVVVEHLGLFYNGILITDFWNAYRNKIGAFGKQKCCRHLLGDVRELLEKDLSGHPGAKAFLQKVKELFKDAISLHNKRSFFNAEEYRSARGEILKRFKALLRHSPLSPHETDNIRKRLITHENELFVFLKYPAVSPTNNFAEQGIRNSVLLRKIIFGNMTKQGQRNVALIMTIIRTAKLRLLNPVKTLRDIMARGVTPALLEKFGLPSAMPKAP